MMDLVVPKRQTQKIDNEPCDCGTTTWDCRRVTPSTPWPWPKDRHPFAIQQAQTWPWVGGILVSCTNCGRTWFGNACMTRFNEIRDQLPADGAMVRVRFEKLGKDTVMGHAARKLARPKRII